MNNKTSASITKRSINLSRRSMKYSKSTIEWRNRLKEKNIFDSNYSFDVILVVESDQTICAATNEIITQGEDSSTVKFLTPANLIKFLHATYNTKPTYEYYTLYDDAFNELREELLANEKLSSESLIYLIKLRILAYNELIAHDRELIKRLKFSLQMEMNTLSEIADSSVQGKGKKKGGKDVKDVKNKKSDKKSKSMSQVKQDTLDAKYLELKAGKQPNFVETTRVPTIYNTDYDEPDPENIYYILSGIYEGTLIKELTKCKVTIVSLVELGFEGVDVLNEIIVDKTISVQELDRMISIRHFWQNLFGTKSDVPQICRNSCYVKYSIPPQSDEPNQNSFENFQILLKNISDCKRLYLHYFKNVRYLDVEDIKKPILLDAMNSYNAFLDQIPNECITIQLMLHALLDEVCSRVDDIPINPEQDMINKDQIVKKKYHGGPVAQIKSLLRQYDCTHKKVPKLMKMPKPVHVSYGNILEYMNAHVPITKYIDTIKITLEGLKKILPLQLFQMIDTRNTFDLMFYKYVFSKWSDQLVNVSVQELTLSVYSYLFTRGNFRKLTVAKLSNHATLLENVQQCLYGVTKLYNESRKTLNVVLNKSFQERFTSIENSEFDLQDVFNIKKNNCDELSQEYCTLAQDLDPATLIQMMNVCFDKYKHFDYKYFAPTDVILVRFHYTSNNSSSKQNKSIFLRTPLCFRDFCYKLMLQDAEWLFNEEKLYWAQVYVNREKEKEYLLQHPKVDDFFDPNEFIIDGSVKNELNKQKEQLAKKKSLVKPVKGKKAPKEEKPVKTKIQKKSRESNVSQSSITRNKNNSLSVPKCESFDKTKTYAFEIYNLGKNYYLMEFEQIVFHSLNLMSVKMKKHQLPKQAQTCSFIVSSQDVNLILHCAQDVLISPVKPLHFNVNILNGIVMVFSIPPPPVITIENKHIVTNKMNTDEIRMSTLKQRDSKSSISRLTKTSTEDIFDLKVSELKGDVLQYLKIALKEKIPVFKIISSRLHKYQYVKRVKSHLTLPIGNIYKRVYCKPVLYTRLSKNQNTYESKCIPYSDLINKERSPMDWKWNASLPTGLSMETVQAIVPHQFYIRQKYVIDRRDLPSIQDEAYRCFLRCGIIMKFLKDGSIKTLSPDKTLSHYKFGYFSSNKRRVSKETLFKDVRLKRATNIIPLHAYKKNLTALEKKVRKISIKYKKHLIDIADNYHFESSRVDNRKLHKIYKLSKRIYTRNSHVIPLINYSVVNSDGRYINIKNNVVHDTLNKYEETRNRDYLLNETIIRREDGTTWMLDKDGNAITQFPDGSRIKTWCTILDENLIFENDAIEEIITPIEAVEKSESFSKFCQTVETDNNIEEDIIFKEPVHVPSKEGQIEFSNYVFIGINYTFEHPNYATVSYYCWEDSSADIFMPDNVQVTAFAEGSYKVKFFNSNDIIHVNSENVEFFVENTNMEKTDKVSCSLNLAAFSMEKPKPKRPFLVVKENHATVFQVTCDGHAVTHKQEYDSSATTTDNLFCTNDDDEDDHNNDDSNHNQDRLFVMKRDFSGLELFKEPIPYKFVHTMIDLKKAMISKDNENVVKGPTKMKIYEPLRKTYSEHLMMMYDLPILATTKERSCIDKLWKLHDIDINTIFSKRKPIIFYERHINFLPTTIILEQLAQAVLKCIIEGSENLPNINLIQQLTEIEESIPKASIVVERRASKKYIPKRFTYKKQLDRFKKLIKKEPIPKYFETIRGLMFLTVQECSEGAMDEYSARKLKVDAKKGDIPVESSQLKLIDKYTGIGTEKKRVIDSRRSSVEPRRSLVEPKKSIQYTSDRKSSISRKKMHHPLKSREIALSSSGIYPGKFNVPENITIHLKPDSTVHDIILTSTGIRVVTDKTEYERLYSLDMDVRQSLTNNTEKNSDIDKEKDLSYDNNQQYNNNISSFFGGEDLCGYYDSTPKVPSWNDSLCQKACVNSFSTTTNTLVTIPDTRDTQTKCVQDECVCSFDTIQRFAKCCRCNKYYCNCKDTYSMFATCSIQNELNISEDVCVLASKIVEVFEQDICKYKLLEIKLEYIIKDTASAMQISESNVNDLIKTVKWIMDTKKQMQNIVPHDDAIHIIKQVEKAITKTKHSTQGKKLTIAHLQKLAELMKKIVCYSKCKLNITKDVIKLLIDAKLSRIDIMDVLKLTIEKIHLFYENEMYQDLPIIPVPDNSKCCQIIEYMDNIIENMVESTCQKCNSKSIPSGSNKTTPNTSSLLGLKVPSNNVLKNKVKKLSEVTDVWNAPKRNSDFPTRQSNSTKKSNTYPEPLYFNELGGRNSKFYVEIPVEKDKIKDELHKIQEVIEEEFDVQSQGGYSLIKSCEEILDVSIPFITNKRSNNTLEPIRNEESPLENITNDGHVEQLQLELQPQPKHVTSNEKNINIPNKDIITIMAPDESELCNNNRYGSCTLLSPIILRSMRTTPKLSKTQMKPNRLVPK